MTVQSVASLALPELILAGSALILLTWGAFRGRADAAFIVASVVALLAAAVASATGPLGLSLIHI